MRDRHCLSSGEGPSRLEPWGDSPSIDITVLSFGSPERWGSDNGTSSPLLVAFYHMSILMIEKQL